MRRWNHEIMGYKNGGIPLRAIKKIGSDEHAQLHVLEAVIAALLFFGALQVAVSLSPDAQTTTALDILEITGQDALRSYYLLPPIDANASEYDNSSLILYLLTGSFGNITDFLNASFDQTISYSLQFTTYPDGNTTLVIDMTRTVDEAVSGHLSFHHTGTLYDVQIFLWREPRRVIQ